MDERADGEQEETMHHSSEQSETRDKIAMKKKTSFQRISRLHTALLISLFSYIALVLCRLFKPRDK